MWAKMSEPQQASEDLSDWQVAGHFEVDGVKYGAEPFSREAIERIKSGDVPEFGVLVSTYPRSGTARLIEICWLLLHDCDVDQAKNTDTSQRHSFLELALSPGSPYSPDAFSVTKTHVDFKTASKLVERKSKIIYGTRNPKDVLVSWYHFTRMTTMLGVFPGTWSQFLELYKQNRFSYGNYFDNVLSWWAEKDRDNIMMVTYEELNDDPLDAIRRMAKFLGQDHSEDKLRAVAEWTCFSNMRDQTSTNYTAQQHQAYFKPEVSTYMRQGTVGGWKKVLSEEDNKYLDEECAKRCTPVGLTFTFE